MSLDYTHRDLLGGTFTSQLYRQDFKATYGGDRFAIFQDPAIAPVGTLFDQSQNRSEKLGVRFTQRYTDIGGSDADIIGDRKSTRLNSITNAHLVCRLLVEIKKRYYN